MSTRSRIEIESHKDPAALEREIDAKRAQISGTVAALENKLSPGELFERALGFARGNGREFADNLAASVKANPVPMLLASVGLAWMMASQHSGHSLTQGYAGSDELYDEDRPGLRDKAGALRARAAGTLGNARQRMSDGGHRAGAAMHRAGDAAHRAGSAVRHRAADARMGFQELMAQQPLAIGAMGIALGALMGAMLPPTEREDALLGSASDRARAKARELADSGLDKASERLDSRAGDGDGRAYRGRGGDLHGGMGAAQPPF